MGANDEGAFVIPPPPPGTPIGRPRPEHPASDAEKFITLPPGIAESATHRIGNPRIVRPPTASKPDEVAFFPVVPGVPRTNGWRIRLGAGEARELRQGDAVFLGRNPAALEDWPNATLLAIDDPSKTLSKTHALLEIDGEEAFIHDLSSTNGVWLVPAGGQPVRSAPGERTPIPVGTTVSLGDYPLLLERPSSSG